MLGLHLKTHRDKRSTLDHVIHSMRVVTLQNIICHFAISLVAHLVTAVHARHALRQADHALQLSHRYPPGGLGHASGAVTLTQTLVLLHDELFRFAGDLQTGKVQRLIHITKEHKPDVNAESAQADPHLRLELPCKEQVSADLIQSVQPVHRLLYAGVQVHDASGDGVVCHLGYRQTHTQSQTSSDKTQE